MKSLFHLALNIGDLQQARAFYGDLLGCREGRSTDSWVDYDFFGHQLSLHLGPLLQTQNTGKVDKLAVPMPHFGVLLPYTDWQALANRLETAGMAFIIEPSLRFAGQAGEQYTMFFADPFGNPIEVKGFRDFDTVFEQ